MSLGSPWGVAVVLVSLIGWSVAASEQAFTVTEATIAQAQAAMDAGALSSVELTVMYLNRLAAYDANGLELNSVPVRNPRVLTDAVAADAARAAGRTAPLLGIPFTVKDSYRVAGLTVAAGSPAFADLLASEDAFTVGRIRAAGGVLLGKTNMPPMAEGGMQEGVYGRAESPYNPAWLAAAYQSGSSNGSGVSTGANFAMFGMGEETVSSGRSPASNNAIVAYTPSRGLLSVRGNWPLYAVRDVVVPHTRSVADMLALLDVIMKADATTEGDLWREQTAVTLPPVDSVRPADMKSLAVRGALKGLRIGVPLMYIGKDDAAEPIKVRPSILALWQRAAADLRTLGAEVVEVPFPVMRASLPAYMPEGWNEFAVVNAWYQERFLRTTNDRKLTSFTQVDPALIFPRELGSPVLVQRGPSTNTYATRMAGVDKLPPPWTNAGWASALRGYETMRRVEFEDWLKAQKLDLVVFPANADLGEATANRDPVAFDRAMLNGIYFSNMNSVMRQLGIPSITVPMGILDDIRMPVGLTFVGPAYSDMKLLQYAYDYEQATKRRVPPPAILPLADETVAYDPATATPPGKRREATPPTLALSAASDGPLSLVIRGSASDASGVAAVRVYVNGIRADVAKTDAWQTTVKLPFWTRHASVIALAKDTLGNTAAEMASFVADPRGRLTIRPADMPVFLP